MSSGPPGEGPHSTPRRGGGRREARPARGDARREARPARGDARREARPAGDAGRREPRPAGDAGRRTAAARVDPARLAAYEALVAVNRDGAYANLALPRLLREHRLAGRDAALATELTYGTLRSVGQLDAILAVAAGRPVERIDPPARDALRLGAYQLLHTRIPDHAAVATTVDLVRSLTAAAAGFANAVLRRVAGKDLPGWLAEVAPAREDDPVGYLALAHAHPEWIVRAFADALGGNLAETEAALAGDNERPTVHLCARPGRITAAQLAAEVGGAVGAFSPYAVRLADGAPGDIESVRRGLAHVQDEGSQLVAAALADAPLEDADAPMEDTEAAAAGADAPPVAADAGERWLDLCAGPGGKAALLGALAEQRGAHVTAVEVAPHRARLVEHAVEGLPVTVVCADGREVGSHESLPAGGFDRVLVDAPCTGLGSLRRRPEARWRRQPGDLPPLTRLQRELLGAALRAVRPGGVVAYVTCSPHVVETRVTVDEATRRSGSTVELADARRALPAGIPELGAGPTVQLWPHRHGTDAMFLALIKKVS